MFARDFNLNYGTDLMGPFNSHGEPLGTRRNRESKVMDASLNFVTPGEDGTVRFVLDFGWTGTRQRPVPVILQDLRPRAHELSLNIEGFLLDRIESAVTDYSDPAQLERLWKPAVIKTVLRATGGKWAVLFAGPNVRYSEADRNATSTSVSAPARAVHSDLAQSFHYGLMERQPHAEDAVRELRERLGDGEPGRWRIFNIWQMISPPPQDTSLALCNLSTLARSDYLIGRGYFDNPGVSSEQILERGGNGDFDITFLKEGAHQEWCYFSNMEPGDTLIFSAFDPQDGPGRGRVAHGAVNLPGAGSGAKPRNSIEIRALVVFEE